MYDNLGAQPGLSRPPLLPQPNPFGNAFAGAGSGLISALGAYGEKILGSSSDYVQSNVLEPSSKLCNGHPSILTSESHNVKGLVCEARLDGSKL